MEPMLDSLYNMDILTLAAGLEDGALSAPAGSVRKVSKLCGSWLELDVAVKDSRVTDAAMRVKACALGQASAAILKENIIGASFDDITSARDALYDMLKAGGAPPTGRFEKLALLKGVADYPARHTSTLLAFDAAVAAMEQALEETLGTNAASRAQ